MRGDIPGVRTVSTSSPQDTAVRDSSTVNSSFHVHGSLGGDGGLGRRRGVVAWRSVVAWCSVTLCGEWLWLWCDERCVEHLVVSMQGNHSLEEFSWP